MSGFIRRYTFDPGNEEITAIEGVVIIDTEPPASFSGLGSGTVVATGEFEDGPFAEPTELFSGNDLLDTFGGFGFEYDGIPSNNPCARSRKSDNALASEFWNGNGLIGLLSKKFRRLIVTRVDTSVGEVEFTRLPSLLGNDNFNWDLEPAQTVTLDLNGTITTATFNATAGLVNSAAGTYPTTFVGGESMNVTIDEGTPGQIGPVNIVFLATDQLQADVIARINATLGYTAATDQGGGITRITGRVRGTSGNVKVNSVSSALVTTATGFSAASAVGTGNVGNIDQVSLADAKSVIELAITGVRVDRDTAGKIRVSATASTAILFDPASTATAFGFTPNQVSQEPNGFAVHTSTAGTYPNGFVGGETLTLGVDDEPDVVVTFQAGDTTQAAVISRINAAFGYTIASDAGATKTRFIGRANGGEFRVVAATGGAAPLTKIGLQVETITARAQAVSSIPAGTRIRNSSGAEWVTMQTTTVAIDNRGPYSIKVRPATDDGTALTSVPLSVNLLPSAILGAAFSATNPQALAAALTEAAIDAAYVTALRSTLSPSSIARESTIAFAARQSNAVRGELKSSSLRASSDGLRGRVCMIRPPLNTPRVVARSGNAQPGVGAYRSDRVIYCYPGANVFIPQIAVRGLSGGAGFTATGFIDVGFDSWVASLCSQLNPEENPGQATDFMALISGLEIGNADVSDMTIDDYKAFKAAGIAALRIDDGQAVVQSGVTSVNPSTHPSLVNIKRRRMADFLQDSIAVIAKKFGKKLATRTRRALVFAEIDGFLGGLLSANNEGAQRIAAYSLDAKTGNTLQTLGAGIFRIKIKVQLLPSMDFIVLETVIGETVDVNELPAAA